MPPSPPRFTALPPAGAVEPSVFRLVMAHPGPIMVPVGLSKAPVPPPPPPPSPCRRRRRRGSA